MQTAFHNWKYAVRQLRKSPVFSVVAVLTLAIGIGATTVMFSVVDNVLLRPLRYAAPQQLVVIREAIRSTGADYPDLPANANHLVFWRANNRSFSGIAALLPGSLIGSGQGGRMEEIGVAQATANLIPLLGFQPKMGRTFTQEEEQPGHDVVLLTNGLWARRYDSDPNIVGKAVSLDGKPYTVVGVLPDNFDLPDSRALGGLHGSPLPIEAFIPFGWTAATLQQIESEHNCFAIGRLKAGVSVVQAGQDLNAMQRLISQQTPDKFNLSATAIPFQEYLVGSTRRTLIILLAAVCGVLLIACINLTNLLLARAAGRSHESALRLALGASHAQLVSSTLIEPFLLAATGCLLGTAAAFIGLPILLRMVPTGLPRINEVQMDWPILVFAIGVSIFSALGCALLPAFRFMRSSPQLSIGSKSHTSGESRSAKRLRRGLVIGEVTASVMLVLLAGLFASSLIKLLHVDRGFQTDNVLTTEVVLPDKQYGYGPTRNAFYERVLDRLRELPGVESAGMVSVLPLDGDNWGDLITRLGDTRPPFERPSARFRWISSGYLETLHVPLLAGRLLSPADKGRKVAVISKQVADTVWPGLNPIGQMFNRGNMNEKPDFEVIGVVGDIRTIDLSHAPFNIVYVPYWYRSRESASFVIRSTADPALMADVVRKAIWSVDSEVAVPNVRTMNTVVDGSVASRRFQMYLLFTFASCSLLLAGLGIYGVVSYSALQRVQEIGLRMALGATRGDVYRLILREGIAPVLIGTVLGVGVASLGGRFLSALLFQVSPYDPWIAGGSCLVLLAIATLACLLPARKATRIEPVEALRYE